jgi:hypothetical protein
VSDERRDGNTLVAFLAGFAVGALIAGGGMGAYFFTQSQRVQAELEEMRAMAEAQRAMAEAEARAAHAAARQAEAELKKIKAELKGKP